MANNDVVSSIIWFLWWFHTCFICIALLPQLPPSFFSKRGKKGSTFIIFDTLDWITKKKEKNYFPYSFVVFLLNTFFSRTFAHVRFLYTYIYIIFFPFDILSYRGLGLDLFWIKKLNRLVLRGWLLTLSTILYPLQRMSSVDINRF